MTPPAANSMVVLLLFLASCLGLPNPNSDFPKEMWDPLNLPAPADQNNLSGYSLVPSPDLLQYISHLWQTMEWAFNFLKPEQLEQIEWLHSQDVEKRLPDVPARVRVTRQFPAHSFVRFGRSRPPATSRNSSPASPPNITKRSFHNFLRIGRSSNPDGVVSKREYHKFVRFGRSPGRGVARKVLGSSLQGEKLLESEQSRVPNDLWDNSARLELSDQDVDADDTDVLPVYRPADPDSRHAETPGKRRHFTARIGRIPAMLFLRRPSKSRVSTKTGGAKSTNRLKPKTIYHRYG